MAARAWRRYAAFDVVETPPPVATDRPPVTTARPSDAATTPPDTVGPRTLRRTTTRYHRSHHDMTDTESDEQMREERSLGSYPAVGTSLVSIAAELAGAAGLGRGTGVLDALAEYFSDVDNAMEPGYRLVTARVRQADRSRRRLPIRDELPVGSRLRGKAQP